jgi:anti-sigma regulatory factor (Ser/Thr protein kinase)
LTAALGEPGATNARLAATELVTNAVRHSGLHENETVVMTATETDRGVHIQVEQSTPAAGAGLIDPSDRGIDPGGFGLRIVEELASGWGVDEGPPGRVWFEMDR